MANDNSRKNKPKAPRVLRITVDERLADDLIRLSVCSLAKGVTEFFDRRGDWSPEREVRARPTTYARRFGIPARQAPPWETLEEGQVYVAGEFEIVGDPAEPSHLRVHPGQKELLRLDDLTAFEDDLKRLYAEVLTTR